MDLEMVMDSSMKEMLVQAVCFLAILLVYIAGLIDNDTAVKLISIVLSASGFAQYGIYKLKKREVRPRA